MIRTASIYKEDMRISYSGSGNTSLKDKQKHVIRRTTVQIQSRVANSAVTSTPIHPPPSPARPLRPIRPPVPPTHLALTCHSMMALKMDVIVSSSNSLMLIVLKWRRKRGVIGFRPPPENNRPIYVTTGTDTIGSCLFTVLSHSFVLENLIHSITTQCRLWISFGCLFTQIYLVNFPHTIQF